MGRCPSLKSAGKQPIKRRGIKRFLIIVRHPKKTSTKEFSHTITLDALKGDGTKVTGRAQNADFRRKPQILADSPLLLEIQAFGGCRKPQKTADRAANHRKLQIGLRHLRSVTFSSAPITTSIARYEEHRCFGPLKSVQEESAREICPK